MKTIKTITNLFLSLCVAVAATSCLNSDDEYTGQASAADVVTVANYSGNNIYFTVATGTNTTATLYSDQAAKVDADAFPVGTRAYITYTYQTGQDTSLPVSISLMSISPVSTLYLTPTTTPPAFAYTPIAINTMYCIGGYINLVVTTADASARTWTCYYDTASSSGNVANLYLDTEATNETATSVSTVLSINIAQLISTGNFTSINFHLLNQSSQNEITLQL